MRYLGYPIGAPHSSLAAFEFAVPEFDCLTPEGVKANALILELEKFWRAGGKLILWHGWADRAILPAGTPDYYSGCGNTPAGCRQHNNGPVVHDPDDVPLCRR